MDLTQYGHLLADYSSRLLLDDGGLPQVVPLGDDLPDGEDSDLGALSTINLELTQIRNITEKDRATTRAVRRDACAEQIERMWEVYDFIYNQFGYTFPKCPLYELELHKLAQQQKLESYMKWKAAYLVALSWRQTELPPHPSYLTEKLQTWGPCLMGSRSEIGFWETRFHSRGNQATSRHLAFCLQQAKAGSLPVLDSAVKVAVDGCIERLTTPPPTTKWVDVLGYKVTKDDLIREIRRTVTEVYGRVTPKERRTPRRLVAGSIRSSFESSRADGGPHQFLCDRVRADLGEQSSYFGFPLLLAFGRYGGGRPCEIYGCFDPDDWDRELETSRRRGWISDWVNAYPVGLVEPFKVRVITRGQVDAYHLARRWQQAIWRPLSDHPTFQLCGTPLSQEIMNDFCGKLRFDPSLELISGDYEAATDHFDPLLTETCLDEVARCLGIPFEDHWVLRKALTRHIFFDPAKACGVDPEVLGFQAKGQLMGSPVSFPILCLLNGALTRYALELAQVGKDAAFGLLSLESLPLLINGDDVLFQGTGIDRLAWKRITAFGGLIPSLGKCSSHKSMCTLNSELWTVRETTDPNRNSYPGDDGRSYTAARLPVPEMGLVRGSIKGGKQVRCKQVERMTSKQDRENHLLDCFTQHLTNRASNGQRWRKFLSTCKDKQAAWEYLWNVDRQAWETLPVGMAACVPAWLGGADLPPPPSPRPGRDRDVSSLQLTIAHYLSDRYFPVGRRLLSYYSGEAGPRYLTALVNEQSRVRARLGIEPEMSPVDSLDTMGDLEEEQDSFLQIPSVPFYGVGVNDGIESEEALILSRKRARKFRKFWNSVRSASKRCGRGPLSRDSLTPSPPRLVWPLWE